MSASYEDKEMGEIISFINGSDSVITANEIANKFEIDPAKAANSLKVLEYNGFITKKGKGAYISYLNTDLRPIIDNELIKINSIIKNRSPFMEFVIWSLYNLRNYYFNIPAKNYIFIEAGKNYELDAIRASLIENSIESVIFSYNKVDFNDFIFKNRIPVILIRRGTKIGTIQINGVVTPTIERTIIDLYYYITKRELPFPVNELGKILKKTIETRYFNFTFIDSYLRIRRSIELDFLLIFSKLSEEFPNLIPEKYNKKWGAMKKNTTSFLGDW